jgi:hypothetical protein
MEEETLAFLLETINEWWEKGETPAEIYYARVATI